MNWVYPAALPDATVRYGSVRCRFKYGICMTGNVTVGPLEGRGSGSMGFPFFNREFHRRRETGRNDLDPKSCAKSNLPFPALPARLRKETRAVFRG